MTKLKILLIIMLFIISGCTNLKSDDNTQHVAILVQNTNNVYLPKIESQVVYNTIYESNLTYGAASVVTIDGNPTVTAEYTITAPEKNLSKNNDIKIAKRQSEVIIQSVEAAKALYEEIDVLKAIEIGARALHTSTSTSKVMLVMSSGLSTKGYLDFTKNILRMNTQDIIKYLIEKEAIPDLSDIDIIWIGLGDVCHPQPELTPSNKNKLKNIWKEILTLGNVKSLTFDDTLPTMVEPDEGLPYVSPIQISSDFEDVIDEDVTNELLEHPIVINETKIQFKPNSSEYVDLDKVKESLIPLIKLLNSQNVTINLFGTTATVGKNEECIDLSYQRAQTVKATLIELGYDAEKIKEVQGLGYINDYHIPDLDEAGCLNEQIAKLNRAVIITVDEILE